MVFCTVAGRRFGPSEAAPSVKMEIRSGRTDRDVAAPAPATLTARATTEPPEARATWQYPCSIFPTVPASTLFSPTKLATKLFTGCSYRALGLSICCTMPSLNTAMRSDMRSEEHTSELQSQSNIVCRLLLVI